MPLFHDPDRRSSDQRYDKDPEYEQPTKGSFYAQLSKVYHRGQNIPDLAGSDLRSSSPEPPSTMLGTSDRQDLIHRIKESSPWRLGYTVCWTQNRPS